MSKLGFNVKEHILENGIELITIQRDTRISSINVGIKIGAIYETEEEKGICHFIEHMLFKGTKTRNNNSINQALEDRGGSYNAYTDYTSTVFSITSLTEELEIATEILSDIITNSIFPEKEIEKERGVILAELKTSFDDIEQYSYNKVSEAAFQKSSLRYDVIGSEESIKKFTKQHLENFYRENFIPNKCVISIVSPYNHDEIKLMIEGYFGKWSQGNPQERAVIVEDNQKIEKISYKKNIEQNTLLYLYTFHGLNRLEELALDILSHKLGESPNSILFRALREDKGIAYDVYSQLDTTEYIKVLSIYTAVGEEDLWEAKEIIDECIDKIKTRKINLDERNILLMKKVIKTAIASILEDSEALGSYVVQQKIMGERIDAFVEDLENLDRIQADDIYRVAQRVLKDPTIHVLMNTED